MNTFGLSHALIRIFMVSACLASGLGQRSLQAAPAPAASIGQCAQRTASGLGYTMLTEGKGAAPKATDKVSIGYKGMLAADGTTFDAADQAEFGVSDVIPGFSEGLMLMKEGGRIRLCIPSALGYGPGGAGKIPPNADLVFEVDLLAIKAPLAPLSASERSCQTRTASGLGFDVLKAGAGAMPGNADVTLINYKGYVAATGAPFDDAGPVPVPVAQVIPGFSEGLKLMQRGGRYKLCIPPQLAYGDRTVGPIPPNSTLVFFIDMVDFKSIAELEAARGQSRQ